MTYKFKLDDSHYKALLNYNIKNFQKLSIVFTILMDVFILFMMSAVFLNSMDLNKEFRTGGVTLNYIISIIFIIIFLILISIFLYKNIIKNNLKKLKFLTFLQRFNYNEYLELIVEEKSLILKSYGYYLEVPKNNITKIIEFDNLILVFNKSKGDTIILPKEVIDVETLK